MDGYSPRSPLHFFSFWHFGGPVGQAITDLGEANISAEFVKAIIPVIGVVAFIWVMNAAQACRTSIDPAGRRIVRLHFLQIRQCLAVTLRDRRQR